MKKKTLRVMVVEDELMIRKNIIKKINKSGYNVFLEAENGEEALSLIEQQVPHIVITDIKMPVMDGLELIKNIYFAYPNIRVIIISGYDDFEYAKTGMHFGIKDFLLKPVQEEELSQSLLRIEIELNSLYDELLSNIEPSYRQLSSSEVADYVEAYIRNNYHNIITVADVAEKLGYSSDYIGKVFKKHKNDNLIKFITKLRIQEAKQLLIDYPNLEIQDIGNMIGYSDPFYFSRVFKKTTGKYPSEMRS